MSTGDGEGPAWNKFWMSLEHDTESVMSGEGSSRMPQTPDTRSRTSPEMARPGLDRGDSVMPNESASHNGADSPEHSALAGLTSAVASDSPFPVKFKAPSGRMHRMQVMATAGISALVGQVAEKLGGEVGSIGDAPVVEEGRLGKSGFALSYLDNEGDTVSITTDMDLLEAVTLARRTNRDKVDLFVHDPAKPPISATVDPHPVLKKSHGPSESILREQKKVEDDKQETAISSVHNNQVASLMSKQEDQFIAGIPNEVLLPGAIVTLAVVIVGVFTFSRGSRN